MYLHGLRDLPLPTGPAPVNAAGVAATATPGGWTWTITQNSPQAPTNQFTNWTVAQHRAAQAQSPAWVGYGLTEAQWYGPLGEQARMAWTNAANYANAVSGAANAGGIISNTVTRTDAVRTVQPAPVSVRLPATTGSGGAISENYATSRVDADVFRTPPTFDSSNRYASETASYDGSGITAGHVDTAVSGNNFFDGEHFGINNKYLLGGAMLAAYLLMRR